MATARRATSARAGVSDTLRCNTRGLMPAGAALMTKLMDKGMLIDLDHMSAKGIDETLSMAEQRSYPLFVGHGLFNEVYGTGGNRHERMRTPIQLARLKALGGHVGPRFGDDGCNGNASQRNAQQSRLAYPVKIPGFEVFDKQVTGQRTFDFNTDGLAHIGLYPDLLGEIAAQGASIEPLMKSAAQLVSAWRKTATSTRPLPTRPVPRVIDPGPVKLRPTGPTLPQRKL